MIYRVRHVTRYDYQTPVDLGAHLAHLRPRPLPHQKVLSAGVHAAPAVSWRRDGTDHFGNEVTWLFLDVAHAAFQVIADATVDVGFPAPPDPAATPAVGSRGAARLGSRRCGLAGGRVRCSTVRMLRPTATRGPTRRPASRRAGRYWRRCST